MVWLNFFLSFSTKRVFGSSTCCVWRRATACKAETRFEFLPKKRRQTFLTFTIGRQSLAEFNDSSEWMNDYYVYLCLFWSNIEVTNILASFISISLERNSLSAKFLMAFCCWLIIGLLMILFFLFSCVKKKIERRCQVVTHWSWNALKGGTKKNC